VADIGFNAADGDPNDSIKLVSEVFPRVLMHDTRTGERFVGRPMDRASPPVGLDTVTTRFRESEIKVSLPVIGTIGLKTFCFLMPRHAKQHLFWDMLGLYRQLNFSQYGKCPSRWVWQSLPSWAKTIGTVVNGSQIVRSTSKTRQVDDVPWPDRCLPSAAVSTIGLLTLMAKWTCMSFQHGGLKEKSDREAVETVWEALMNIAFGSDDRPVTIRLRIDPDWQCCWPRPDAQGFPMFELEVDKSGFIHFGELASAAAPARSCQTTMVRKLQSVRGRNPEVAVNGRTAIAMFSKAQDAPSLSLARQIAWCFATKLELALGKQAKNTSSAGGEDFAWADPDADGKFAQALDLVKYVLGGRNAATGHHTFVATMDECEGIGMTLVNMVVGLHDNHGIMCVPNVDDGFDPEHIGSELDQNIGSKLPRTGSGDLGASLQRQAAWLQRCETQQAQSFRPRTLHRVGAKKCLDFQDNQLRTSLGINGLAFFKPNFSLKAWLDWRTWPALTVAMDLGPKNNGAAHAAMYKFGLNYVQWADASHGAHRDFVLWLKACAFTTSG